MNTLQNQITLLKKKLTTMATLAQTAVQRSVQALVERDSGLAAAAKEHDKAIDDLEMEIDELAIELLTAGRSAPEVRLLTVVMKIARDLERVGDEATTISRRAFELSQDTQLQPSVDIPEATEFALAMFKEALEAFVEADPAAARAVIARDKQMDATNKQVQRSLTQHIMKTPAAAPRCLNLMVISKSLERIADHATNIAEDVVYLYEGRDIRHTGKGKVRPAESDPSSSSSQMP
jgi:phosphate transport system protein